MFQYHIFKVQADGSLRWMEAAADVERAKALVNQLAANSPGEYVISNLTGEKISIISPPKRILFQIGYNEKELGARTELFRRFGHEVISVADNNAAKRALASIENVDVFIVGHQAPAQTREEMVDWLKANFPKSKIVALIPSAAPHLSHADYNVVLNDWDELISLLAAAAS
jgi:hypothetical protein